MIEFTVYGKPRTLKRHRDGKHGKYDPSAADKLIFVSECIDRRPARPIDYPVIVEMDFCFKNHQSEPDVDNCVKFILDALNEIFWKDDKFVVGIKAFKTFGATKPRTIIKIYSKGEYHG